LPDIIDAGIYSLKIEGRMKNVTYAAEVTNIYRKYVDMYLEKGRKGYNVSEDDINELLDIYNRGGFSTGYYREKKGKAMMSLERPNHMGTLALEVIENVRGRVTFKALRDINLQDVFEIDSENSFSSGGCYRTGESFVVNLPSKYPLKKGRKLYRTRNNRITQKVLDDFVENTRNGNRPVDMCLNVSVGEPVSLKLTALGFEAEVQGELVQTAEKSPADEKSVRDKLMKLGNTPFVAGNIQVVINGNAFLPVAWINELRRQGVEALTEKILSSYRREYEAGKTEIFKNAGKQRKDTDIPLISVLVSNEEQLKEAVRVLDENAYIYVERTALTPDAAGLIKTAKSKGICVAVALPHIVTQQNNEVLRKLILKCTDCGVDTFLVRNLEEIGILGEAVPKAKIVTDANLYVWNTFSFRLLKNIVETCGLKLLRVTYPYELTSRELAQPEADCDTELVVSSRIPVMVSKQCVRKTYGLCDHSCGSITVTDRRKQADYGIFSKCDYCYSVMYAPSRLEIDRNDDIVKNINPDFVRYEFNTDSERVDIERHFEEGFKAHLITGVE
jgi:putative protease